MACWRSLCAGFYCAYISMVSVRGLDSASKVGRLRQCAGECWLVSVLCRQSEICAGHGQVRQWSLMIGLNS